MTRLSSALQNWQDDAESLLQKLQKQVKRDVLYKDRFKAWNRIAAEVQESSEKLSELLYLNRRELKNRNIAIKTKMALAANLEKATTELVTVLAGIIEQHGGSSTPTRTAAQMKTETLTTTGLLFAARNSMVEAIEGIEELIVELRNKPESAASITRVEVRVDTSRFQPPDNLLPGLNDAS